jgi:hypothetical protein
MPLLGVTVGIDPNRFFGWRNQLARVRAGTVGPKGGKATEETSPP